MRITCNAAIVAAVAMAAGPSAGRAQAPVTNTEVYLAPFNEQASPPIGLPVDISNAADYDNQPSFTPDGASVLFTSKRDRKQTDIYRYDLATKQLTQLTHTPESEYSPLVTPDGTGFSVVRVEADNTQRLWRFDLDGTHPRLVLENVKPVGYHVWIDATHVAVYVLGAGSGDPATLQIVDTTTGASRTVDSGIGHTLVMQRTPRMVVRRTGQPGDPPVPLLTYVKRVGSRWQFQQVDPARPGVDYQADVQTAAAVAEDFALFGVGQTLVPQGATIQWSNIDTIERPEEGYRIDTLERDPALAADFTSGPVKNITRLTVSPDGKWIAFVAEPAGK